MKTGEVCERGAIGGADALASGETRDGDVAVEPGAMRGSRLFLAALVATCVIATWIACAAVLFAPRAGLTHSTLSGR